MRPQPRKYRVCLLVALALGSGGTVWGEEESAVVKAGVQAAFLEVHDGWSADEVLLQEDLNTRFVAAAARICGEGTTPGQLNWALLNLRKADRLTGTVTQRRRDDPEKYQHAAEIAARWLEDRQGMNCDRALCDPQLRAEFDRVAAEVAPGVEPYLVRKAALGLRKGRKLRPELIARVADWGKEVSSISVDALAANLELAPQRPGVYLFRDGSGYLYVGEAADLRARLHHHVTASDRASLAAYLTREGLDLTQVRVEIHAFAANSRAREMRYRRAYESELIASRKPRFNVRP